MMQAPCPVDINKPFNQIFDNPVWQDASKTAIIFEDNRISYRQLHLDVCGIANYLLQKGIGKADRISIMARNSDMYIKLALATNLIGAVLVGINWRLSPKEVQYIANHSDSALFFVGSEFFSTVQQITDQLPKVKQIIGVETPFSDSFPTSLKLIDEQKQYGTDRPNIADSVTTDDIVVQLYTSGTTGLPKGVEAHNGGMMKALEGMHNDWWGYLPVSDDASYLCCLPMYHIAGLNVSLIALTYSYTLVIVADFDPVQVLDVIQSHSITFLFLVPAAIQFLLMMPNIKEYDLSSLQVLAYGASPINESVLSKAMEILPCSFVQVYGMTETNGYATFLTHQDHVDGGKKLLSCGKPGSVAEISILDEDFKAVATGSVGQIAIRSGANMKGYWQQPDATAQTITQEGWLLTGDAGYIDAEGYVYIYDRVKDMIVSGGENIYPNEIENELTKHPNVSDAAVVSKPDDRFGEAVHAVLVSTDGTQLTLEQLVTWLGGNLASFKLPKSIEYIDMLPRNPSGKILRRELRDKFWAGKSRRVN